ncbi:MAG: D-cysteine desulfhydrase family protein [Myxococcales bacterium]|nr:D-cysteine desulfhydrase family protein [Myxococcales bacterium]
MTSRVPLARLPTPEHALPRLSEALGVEVFVKRDDLTGFGLSGNKVRKLERLFADAGDATAIITTGGIQSNHCRATALAARQRGLVPHLLLRGEPPAEPDGNLLLDELAGATIRWCTPEVYRDQRDAVMAEMAAGLRAEGERPYVIPEGGSDAVGSLAFADAPDELEGTYDHVFVAVGSGGTLAGLAMSAIRGRVHGIAVCDDSAYFTAKVRSIAAAAGRPTPADWHVDDRYKGPAYSVATPAIWDDIRLVCRLEGLLLDPCYTGKAMHALCEEARAGRLSGRVLFWHTGGAFGLFGRGAEVR